MTIDLTPALDAPFDGLSPGGLADLGPVVRGKVRDMIDLGDRIVLVATDRISAFDHVLGTVPYRGQVLNQLAAWWFDPDLRHRALACGVGDRSPMSPLAASAPPCRSRWS